MLRFSEELVEELLREYPDPREGEAKTLNFRRKKELEAALPRRALVTDNRDPEGLGRVRTACDMLAPGAVTGWLPVAGTGRGGDGSGVWSLPDAGTQVLLVFPGGDTGRPLVLGCVFDEKHRPPEFSGSSADTSFVWQTKNHRLEIYDTEDGEVFVISGARGQMRYTAGPAGIQIVNELGDIDITCKKLKIETDAGLSLAAGEKLTVRAGTRLRGKGARKTVIACEGAARVKGKNLRLNGSRGVTACGRQMAKSGDAVMGFDIHKTEIPSGKGTSTVLLPHPFIGKLSKGLSPNVTVGGAACAVLGSIATHNDSGHNRLPGTVRFTQNPKNEGEVSGAAAETVTVNGRKAALAGSTVSTCSDTGQKDHSLVRAAGASVPMPAIINPENTAEYMLSRGADETFSPAFTAVNWSQNSADEGRMIHLWAQVKDIADGNIVTFQIWRDTDDPGAHAPRAVISAEVKDAAAAAVWSWSLDTDSPPPEDPRFFFTAHSAWCAAEKSALLTLRLARPYLEAPEWTNEKDESVQRCLAGESLRLSVRCGRIEDGTPVLFRVYSASGGAALAEIPAEVSGGKAAAEWTWRITGSQEPFAEKPRFVFTAKSSRCGEVTSAEMEVSSRIAFWLLSADGMLISRAKGSLFREGENRNIEISGGFFEDASCVPGRWSFRLDSIAHNGQETPQEFETGEKPFMFLAVPLDRLMRKGVLLGAGGKDIVILATQEKGYSL